MQQQQQQIRPQVNVNKPLQQPQPQAQAPNYQQQQQNYRLPSPGQQQQQQQPSNLQQQQPPIRPPLAQNVRPLINPQQAPNIRNLPPQQQQQPQQVQQVRPNPQFRPPQQQLPAQQQGFPPRLPFQQPDLQQQQFRPQVPQQVPLQRQPRPPLPVAAPQIQSSNNMMAEMNREKTFTTNNNNGGSEQSIDDDDDDVVVGRLNTPQNKNGQKPVESQGVKENAPLQRPVIAPIPEVRRRESVQSIPSRPASGLGSNHSNQSASPEPKSPGVIQQQQFNTNNRPEQINRTDMNRQGDNMRDSNDYERVQRPSISQMPPQQRQSPEDMNRSKVPVQPPTIQDHLPFMKPNLVASEAPLRKEQEVRKPAPTVSDMKKPIDLDLAKAANLQSSKINSPSKKVHYRLSCMLIALISIEHFAKNINHENYCSSYIAHH